MKKTININLAGLSFQIDDDAYELLDNYLNKLKQTFTDPNEQKEILDDIEHRFAELFSEKLGKRAEVVNYSMVKETIETLGDVEVIEDEANDNAKHKKSGGDQKGTRKLFRSVDDKVISGVLGGLGAYFGVDPIWLRLIFVLLAIASVGIPVVIIYIILWLVMPKALTSSQKLQMKGEPVNLNNLQENIKKNLSSESIENTGNRMADGIGELIRMSIKVVLVIIGLAVGLKLLAFTFIWFFGTLFANVMAPEYVTLIFDSSWQFLVLSISCFVLLALPFIVGIFLLFKAVSKQDISWGKTMVVTVGLLLIALVTTLMISFTVASNYKVKASSQNFVELELNDSLQELKLEFVNQLENDEFRLKYKKGKLESSGFNFDGNGLKLNTISLNIQPSLDDSYSLMVHKKSRGVDIEDANSHLENFSYQVETFNGETLVLPTTLNLVNETKFRLQEMAYYLEVPVGTNIQFPKNAHDYINDVTLKGDYKQKSLDNNTWLMTGNGLECLTCTEVEVEEESSEKSLDKKIEDLIEKEIEEALNE